MNPPLPSVDLPTVILSIADMAQAKRKGYLHIHDNGVSSAQVVPWCEFSPRPNPADRI